MTVAAMSAVSVFVRARRAVPSAKAAGRFVCAAVSALAVFFGAVAASAAPRPPATAALPGLVPDVSVTVGSSPATFTAGQTATVTVTVRNDGVAALPVVVVSADAPAALVTVPSGCLPSGRSARCLLTSGSRSSRTLSFGVVVPDGPTTVTAAVTGLVLDASRADDSATVTINAPAANPAAWDVRTDPAAIAVGDDGRVLEVVATNTSGTDLEGWLQVAVPAGVRLTDPAGECVFDMADVLWCATGLVVVDDQWTKVLTVVDVDSVGGITLTLDAVAATVEVASSLMDMAVTVEPPSTPVLGSGTTIVVSARNNGPSEGAASVTIDAEPGWVFSTTSGCVTPSPRQAVCSLGWVPAGVTRTVSVSGSVTGSDPVRVTASVQSAVTDPNRRNDTAVVQPEPTGNAGLLQVVSLLDDKGLVTGLLSELVPTVYVARVANNGSAPIALSDVTFSVNANLTPVTAPAGCVPVDGGFSCPQTQWPAGEVRQFVFTALPALRGTAVAEVAATITGSLAPSDSSLTLAGRINSGDWPAGGLLPS